MAGASESFEVVADGGGVLLVFDGTKDFLRLSSDQLDRLRSAVAWQRRAEAMEAASERASEEWGAFWRDNGGES